MKLLLHKVLFLKSVICNNVRVLICSAVGCPYSDININKDSVLPDRLSGEMPGSGGLGRPRRAEPNPDINPAPALTAE